MSSHASVQHSRHSRAVSARSRRTIRWRAAKVRSGVRSRVLALLTAMLNGDRHERRGRYPIRPAAATRRGGGSGGAGRRVPGPADRPRLRPGPGQGAVRRLDHRYSGRLSGRRGEDVSHTGPPSPPWRRELRYTSNRDAERRRCPRGAVAGRSAWPWPQRLTPRASTGPSAAPPHVLPDRTGTMYKSCTAMSLPLTAALDYTGLRKDC